MITKIEKEIVTVKYEDGERRRRSKKYMRGRSTEVGGAEAKIVRRKVEGVLNRGTIHEDQEGEESEEVILHLPMPRAVPESSECHWVRRAA